MLDWLFFCNNVIGFAIFFSHIDTKFGLGKQLSEERYVQ